MINNMFHKVMSKACELRLKEMNLQEPNTMQAAFRKGRGCQGLLFMLRAIIDAMKTRGKPLHACFVDFAKAFDSIPRRKLWASLQKLNVPSGLI